MRTCTFLLCALLAWSGCCGYSARSLLPPHLRTVAVLPATNSTTRPGIEEILTDSLIAAFGADRNLRVTSLEDADLVLNVDVNSYSKTAAVFDEEQTVSVYDVVVSAQVEAEDQVRSEVFFQGSVSGRKTYDPEESTGTGDPEDAAAAEAVGEVAREIVRGIITQW